MKRHKKVFKDEWLLPQNTNPNLNRGRVWKWNPSCSQAWKNEVSKIETAERYKTTEELE